MPIRRTGRGVTRHTAYKLCRLVTKFTPIIQRAYPNNPSLMLALETANAACSVLVSELDAVAEYGD